MTGSGSAHGRGGPEGGRPRNGRVAPSSLPPSCRSSTRGYALECAVHECVYRLTLAGLRRRWPAGGGRRVGQRPRGRGPGRPRARARHRARELDAPPSLAPRRSRGRGRDRRAAVPRRAGAPHSGSGPDGRPAARTRSDVPASVCAGETAARITPPSSGAPLASRSCSRPRACRCGLATSPRQRLVRDQQPGGGRCVEMWMPRRAKRSSNWAVVCERGGGAARGLSGAGRLGDLKAYRFTEWSRPSCGGGSASFRRFTDGPRVTCAQLDMNRPSGASRRAESVKSCTR